MQTSANAAFARVCIFADLKKKKETVHLNQTDYAASYFWAGGVEVFAV